MKLVSTNEAVQVRSESRDNNSSQNLLRGIAKAYTI